MKTWDVYTNRGIFKAECETELEAYNQARAQGYRVADVRPEGEPRGMLSPEDAAIINALTNRLMR